MKTVTLIHTSDIHGVIESSEGGFLKISSYVQNLSEPKLIIDTGDCLQGSPETYFLKDNQIQNFNPYSTIMNTIGYSYMVPGNHDFNYGLKYLNSFIANFKGDILCANVYDESGLYFKKGYDVKDINGIRFLLIGLTNHFIPNWEDKDNIKGLSFEHPTKYLENHLNSLKIQHEPDVVVVLYHGGFECDDEFNYLSKDGENSGCSIIKTFEDVDIVLSSHEHRTFIKNKGKSWISQPGYQGKQLIEYQIHKSDTEIHIKPTIIHLNNQESDQKLSNKIDDFTKSSKQFLKQVIGKNKSKSLQIKDQLNDRIHKPMFAQLINQLQMQFTGVDISLNALSNDCIGLNDDITIEDVIKSYPYANTLSVCEISGETLKEALYENAQFFTLDQNEIKIKASFLVPKKALYQYDFYDGISYEMIINSNQPNEVKNIIYKNKPIEDKSIYRIVMNSYRIQGGGYITWQKKLKIIKTYPLDVSEIMIQSIQKLKSIEFKYMDNISIQRGV